MRHHQAEGHFPRQRAQPPRVVGLCRRAGGVEEVAPRGDTHRPSGGGGGVTQFYTTDLVVGGQAAEQIPRDY